MEASRYFITFSCYGTKVHGEENDSVDRHRNTFGSPRGAKDWRPTKLATYSLNEGARESVLSAMQEVCKHRNWTLLAAHVRSTHVHAVVEATVRPEEVMNDFKRYASRRLNETGPRRKYWSRHGSTRWLWKDEDVRKAIQYVIEEQGSPMAVYRHPMLSKADSEMG